MHYPVNASEHWGVMTEPINRIVQCLPREFFQALLEQMDAAFTRALGLTRRHYQEPEQFMMLGQNRHAFCEEAFRVAAEAAALANVSAYTEPAGGRFSLVNHGEVSLIRSNVQVHCGLPRPSKFRQEFAALNGHLSPVQNDLFEDVSTPSADRVCGMVVVTANRRGFDQSVPAFAGLGVPRSDLSSWISLEPITAILARYHDIDAAAHRPREVQVEVKDRAVPRLKSGMTKKGTD